MAVLAKLINRIFVIKSKDPKSLYENLIRIK